MRIELCTQDKHGTNSEMVSDCICYIRCIEEFYATVLIRDFDYEKWAKFEKTSKFHSENGGMLEAGPGVMSYDLFFEKLEDAEDFVVDVKRRNGSF